MALQLTIERLGVTYVNTYIRVNTAYRNRARKIHKLELLFFGNRNYGLQNPRRFFTRQEFTVIREDFDEYFRSIVLSGINNIDRAQYNFLKTINATDSNSSYSFLQYDFTQATDV